MATVRLFASLTIITRFEALPLQEFVFARFSAAQAGAAVVARGATVIGVADVPELLLQR